MRFGPWPNPALQNYKKIMEQINTQTMKIYKIMPSCQPVGLNISGLFAGKI